MLHLDDSICAVATPPGEGGVGIVRISGPAAFQIADRLFSPLTGTPSSFESHTIHFGHIVDRSNDETVDDALLLVFRAPASYTGEDVVEFSCHGGPVTLGRVIALALKDGARLAEPGEFTQRAFLNGRMDLSQAEAVCDQIRAKTEAAQRLARRQKDGQLSKAIHRVRDDIVGALAAVEVTIDFSEEVGELDYPAVIHLLKGIRNDLEMLARTADRGRLYREGVRIAIVGRPNVGKSSLLNALLRQDRAIVTPIAGTTRDVIEEAANIRGIPITAIDTAGIRETEDVVERLGVERAHSAIESATMVLFVIDGAGAWSPEDDAIACRVQDLRAIWVVNKADLLTESRLSDITKMLSHRAARAPIVFVSATEGIGIDKMEEVIAASVLGSASLEDSVVISNVRHLNAIQEAVVCIQEAEKTTLQELPPDFISIDLRGALDALGQITGETATEEIVHRIFHDFCVGK